MNRILNKTICTASIIVLSSIYTLPIFAAFDDKTMYGQMNKSGEIYKTVSDGENKDNDLPI